MPHYPYLDIVLSIGTSELLGEALPDTGYDGDVIVPRLLASEIAAAPIQSVLRMADQHPVHVDTWDGQLDLNGAPFTVQISAFGDEFIVGRGVLNQLEICFCFGREVRLRFTE